MLKDGIEGLGECSLRSIKMVERMVLSDKIAGNGCCQNWIPLPPEILPLVLIANPVKSHSTEWNPSMKFMHVRVQFLLSKFQLLTSQDSHAHSLLLLRTPREGSTRRLVEHTVATIRAFEQCNAF